MKSRQLGLDLNRQPVLFQVFRMERTKEENRKGKVALTLFPKPGTCTLG